MIVSVGSRVDVESRSEATVAIETFAFLVTSKLWATWDRITCACQALEVLLMVTTGATDIHLYLTGCGFFARWRYMLVQVADTESL